MGTVRTKLRHKKLRIANWNVERPSLKAYAKNKLRISKLLSLDADLIVLTETSKAIDLGPKFKGYFTKPSRRKPRPGEAVASIWVHESTLSVVREVDTCDPTEAICLELSSDFGPLLIYGSIIPYHGYKGVDGKSGRWHEHKKAIRWHASDWIHLRKKFPKHHLVTTGDYNQHRDGVGRYGNREIRQLLTGAFETSDLKCVTEMDFVALGKLSRRNVDHVCLTPGLASALIEVNGWEGTCNGNRLSDHNGIVVDIDSKIAASRN